MQGKKTFKIAIVAGEVSGDLLAAGLMRELNQTPYSFEFEGIAGNNMEKQGCVSLFAMHKLTVMGLDGLLGSLFEILKIRRQLAEKFISEPPDLFIGVDAPDFNLSLEKKLRKAGVPVMHYVSPTVWAWRKYRLKSMHHAIDKILVLFPFELDFYKQHNIPAQLVGHPMVQDMDPKPDVEAIRQKHGLSMNKKVIGLFPGSRRGEIERMTGDFIQAAQKLSEQFENLQFVTAMPNEKLMEIFETEQKKYGGGSIDLVRIVGHSREVMASTDLIMIASGTAALEAAVAGKAMVVAYKVSWLTKIMVQLLARVKYFSMPNNLAGYELVPELMQDACTPENLVREMTRYLEDAKRVKTVEAELVKMRESLDLNSDRIAAEQVLKLLGLSVSFLEQHQ